LRDRWQSQEPASSSDGLLLRYGPTVSRAAELSLPSPWLRRTDSEILEVVGSEDDVILQLLDADVPLVVLSGMHSTRHLDMLSGHPTARIVFNNPLCSSADGRRLLHEVLRLPDGLQRVHFVDASSTLRALDIFQNTRKSDDVEGFQELYMNSRISKLARDLEAEFALSSRERRSAAGVFVAQKTLDACRHATQDALQRAEETRSATAQLRQQIAMVQREADDDASSSAGRLSVSVEIAKAEESLRRVMESLRWWQLPLHLDDISYIVQRAVDSSWGIELEKKVRLDVALYTSLSRSPIFSSPLRLEGYLANSRLQTELLMRFNHGQAPSSYRQSWPMSSNSGGPIRLQQSARPRSRHRYLEEDISSTFRHRYCIGARNLLSCPRRHFRSRLRRHPMQHGRRKLSTLRLR